LSTYLILYSFPIYDRMEPLLRGFERRNPIKGDEEVVRSPVDVILFGYGRFGRNLVPELVHDGLHVTVVDWDPQSVARDPGHERIDIVFGDADDPEFPGTLPLEHACAVVSTIPDVNTNLVLAGALRRWGFDGVIVATAHTEADARRVDGPAVDLVLQPFEDAAELAARQLLAQIGAP